MKAALLAVDIGSTNVKALLFDEGGSELFSESVAMKDFYADKEAEKLAYCDPEVLYADIVRMIRKIADAAAGEYETAAVSVTGMGGDALPMDKNGDALYPFISWKCRRTMDAYRELGSRMGFERYFMVSGLQARPMDTVFKMMWMRENEPTIYGKTAKWLFIEDYIVYKLCGNVCTDRSIASISGLYDIAAGRWSDEIASYARLDTTKLPPLVRGGEAVGRVSRQAAGETNLKQGLPVVQGGWDIQCAALAMGAVSKNAVVDTMGTWETVNIVQDRPVLTGEFYSKGFNVCAHVAEGLYTYPVFLLSSGIVEWYMKNNYPADGNGERDYASFLKDIRKSETGAGGVVFLPHIAGSNFPDVDPGSRGAFAGITEQTKKEDFSRAVIEGLTYMSAQVVCECESIIKSRLDHIAVTGGGTRNGEWMKIKADVLGKSVFVSKMAEDSARGAAMLAGIGCGVYAGVQDATGKVGVHCKPQEPSPESNLIYRRYLDVFEKMYDALKGINSDISVIRNGTADCM